MELNSILIYFYCQRFENFVRLFLSKKGSSPFEPFRFLHEIGYVTAWSWFLRLFFSAGINFLINFIHEKNEKHLFSNEN